ncbi:hypothetical protein CO037_00190 [Candidatus Pacearchaeota archaeon CG_4_9_14_0_2_um_filter_30_8]|nr:MAG: hypothetical protein CO037_00190 [Candidatus Pacearchaeota archaeon CG_4_9_14_0_2_um_filter_30_8]
MSKTGKRPTFLKPLSKRNSEISKRLFALFGVTVTLAVSLGVIAKAKGIFFSTSKKEPLPFA